MNPDSENFTQLRRLLVLKRYEQPPPGYFHGFSRQVIVRIKAAGESAHAASSPARILEGDWLRRIWGAFEARPALAGAFGVAVCGFFVAGALISSDNNEPTGVAIDHTQPTSAAFVSAANPAAATPWQQASADHPSTLGAASALPSQDSLFDQIQGVTKPRAVSWQVPATAGGN